MLYLHKRGSVAARDHLAKKTQKITPGLCLACIPMLRLSGTYRIVTVVQCTTLFLRICSPPTHTRIRMRSCAVRRQAVEAAIHSTRGLQGRDQRLKEWKSQAYGLSNAEARALSARLLDGKQVCAGLVCVRGYFVLNIFVHLRVSFSFLFPIYVVPAQRPR